ncbi:MAG: nitroreductase family protein [Candidatus Omnitrophica bacterium]|nr:nitroreductase family protein [Candidatus Omnitrophota bacterium]
MDCLSVIKRRRSVREFIDKPIPQEVLEAIVDAGRFAPTARNIQPWEFIVVTDKQSLKNLAEITDHGKFLARAAACICVVSTDTKYYLEDCSAATQNILLAAVTFKVGSCWIAADKKPYCEKIKELLGIPPKYKVVSLIALGYPLTKKVFYQMPKRPLEEVLHWQKFSR